MAYYAYQHLVRQDEKSKLPFTLLYIPAKKVGSLTLQAMIEEEATMHKYVLVMESARDDNKRVTERKSFDRFEIRTIGQKSHSGLSYQDGRSAILKMACQIIEIEAMKNYDIGITKNVGEIQGGTGVNVVPAECFIGVDLRMPTPELAEEHVIKILNLKSSSLDVTMEIFGGLNRPPSKKDTGVSALFEHAWGLAAEIRFDLQDTSTGGGSDGNFTAALSISTLDGLGADGYGARTLDETIYFLSIELMPKLWVRLVETLE
jgi:glutamate carboxypeptidase